MRDPGLTGHEDDCAARGDDDRIALLQKLFLGHSPALRDYLLALVPDPAAVDDLLHSIFLTAVQRADQFQPGTHFLAWVRTIGKYKLMEWSRDRHRNLPTFAPEVIDALSETAADFDQQSERLTAMAECTEELAPRARQAIHLRYLEDLRPASPTPGASRAAYPCRRAWQSLLLRVGDGYQSSANAGLSMG